MKISPVCLQMPDLKTNYLKDFTCLSSDAHSKDKFNKNLANHTLRTNS